jgi:hypothetical protein
VPGITCANTSATCSASGTAHTCDVGCSLDSDCSALSSAHVCDGGFCRAPAGDPPHFGTLTCEPSSITSDQVLIIGDNLFAGTNSVGAAFDASAQAAGILQTGAQFQDESRATQDALAYMGQGIQAEYVAGNPNGNVRLVIMTGGGVDAVFGACEETTATCPVLTAAADAATTLLQQMATEGVQQVVYAFYPDPGDAAQKAKVDVLRTLIQPVCETAPVACLWLDLRTVFRNHYNDYVTPAGLTAQGAAATAEAIWTATASCLAP